MSASEEERIADAGTRSLIEADLRDAKETEDLRAQVTGLQTRMTEMVNERQAANRYGSRDLRQRIILGWATRVFGLGATLLKERALRLVEEAIEAAQSVGVDRATILLVAGRVYDRDVGDLRQELGGVAVTLAAFCEAAKVSAEEVERDEMERVLAVPEDHFRARQAEKADLGLGVRPEP